MILAVGRALTTTPWNDEAWYSSPSWSLIHFGTTGTPLLETAGQFWKGLNLRTYWVVPLQFFVQVPWFKLFGFSLFSARAFAMAWGLVGLVSWGLIVRRITGDAAIGFWTMAFLAIDYQFVSQMSLDRMDAMSLGLASLAILSYIELRERNLAAAVFVSQTCVAACGMTHPTPGVPVLFAVLFISLYYDRQRITWKLLLLAAIPFIIFGAGWYWYISAAPDLFRAQFFGNVTDIDRLGGFKHPLQAIVREIGRHAGMGGFAAGMASLYRIKILSVLIYFVAAFLLLFNREARRLPGIRPLLGLWLVYLLLMTFYDNTKEVKYAVHLIPAYDAVIAACLVWVWRTQRNLHWLAAGVAAVFAVINVGGIAYTIARDDYRKGYLPAANFIKTHAKPEQLVLAGSEFGFALGFDSNLVDDMRFTYWSHKTPEFIVLSQNSKAFIESARLLQPKVYEYEQKLFAERYTPVYSQNGYEIWRRRAND